MNRGIFLEDLAQSIIDTNSVGTPYRPSNGMEGMLFEEAYCGDCQRENEGEGCDIQTRAFCFGKKELEFPSEWVYGPDGQPTCTAFQEKVSADSKE